jgi:DNA primase
MRFPPTFLDEIRARLPVSQVVARKVALKRAGREFKGLSPFKIEKTPSFFVNDQKGSWFDFSSGQNGDIFKFVMLTEGLSFPEAVERLAEEAGIALPKPTQRDRQEEDQRQRLYALLEAAAKFFEDKFKETDGHAARRYLEKRGLARETIARFRLGYAPNGKSALKEYLGKAGFSLEDASTSGMLVHGDDIPVAYDRFRHRVMFPITDLKDRVIAFGGRALDQDVPAKYLNSPETPLFHKGSVLFHAAKARGPAHERGRIIAVEGYMDVLALSEAGFAEVVAPLGSTLTEDQLHLLWRMAPEPILCFDGDSAGRSAAFRAIDTVLPHLKPGASVCFAFLPDGLDPDDLIRQKGARAFEEILQKTRALFDVLWEREEKKQPLTTPEQRAAFEARLRALVSKISNSSVRVHYEREVNETLWVRNRALPRAFPGAVGENRQGRLPGRRNNVQPDWRLRERARFKSLQRTPPIARAVASQELVDKYEMVPQREALIIKTLLNHPWLIEEHCEEIASLTVTSKPLACLRDALLEIQASNLSLDREAIRAQLSRLGLDKMVVQLERAITHKSDRFAEPDTDRCDVERGWRHAILLHERQVGLRRALESAEQAWLCEPSEEHLTRITEIQERLATAHTMEDALEDAGEA